MMLMSAVNVGWIAIFCVVLLATVTPCSCAKSDDDTLPADDSYEPLKKQTVENGEELQNQASEKQRPEAQFVYNPYGFDEFRRRPLFSNHHEQEPFYFYTRDDDDDEEEEEEEELDGPFEPFSFNEERINLKDFDKKKKSDDNEFQNLERGDYLDPSKISRSSFLVVTGGLFPNHEDFNNDVEHLEFGKKSEVEFAKIRKRFQQSLQYFPPYYLDDPQYDDHQYDPFENYDPYAYQRPPRYHRPTLPPYSSPPPRRLKNKTKKPVEKIKPPLRKKPRKPIADVPIRRKPEVREPEIQRRRGRQEIIDQRGPTRAPRTREPKRRKKQTRAPLPPRTRAPTPRPPPPPSTIRPKKNEPPRITTFEDNFEDELGIFGRRINIKPPKIIPGDKIDELYYGKIRQPARRNNDKQRKKTPKPNRYETRKKNDQKRFKDVKPTVTPPPQNEDDDESTGVARIYHYSTFGNSGNMRGFAYTIVI